MHQDSIDKVVTRYLATVARQPFSFKGKEYHPKPLKVSPLLLRDYTCPPGCGGCCFKFSLDYLPSEDRPPGTKQRMVEFNGRQVEIWTDWQEDNKDIRCQHLQRETGRCGIYAVRPFTCDFELVRTLQFENDPNVLTQKLFGRGWSYARTDGGKGAKCEMRPATEHSTSEVVRKLKRLKAWADHFGVDTWLPDLIEVVEEGKLTEQIVFCPPAANDAKKEQEAVPNTQSLCVSPATELSPDELIDHHFNEAVRIYDLAAADDNLSYIHENICFALRKLSVAKARLIGEHLNRAKEAVQQQGRNWLPVLRQKFGKERNGQNFMEVARRWDECGVELEKNPNHSIDSLLRALRKKDKWPWPQPSEEVLKHREVFHRAKRLFMRVWPVWYSDEIEVLHKGLVGAGGVIYDEFQVWLREATGKLRWRVRRQVSGFNHKEFRTRVQLRLCAQEAALKEVGPNWSIVDELCPQDYAEKTPSELN